MGTKKSKFNIVFAGNQKDFCRLMFIFEEIGIKTIDDLTLFCKHELKNNQTLLNAAENYFFELKGAECKI